MVLTKIIGMVGNLVQKISMPVGDLLTCDSYQSLGLKTLIAVGIAALWLTSGSLGIDKYKDEKDPSLAKTIFALQIVIGGLIVLMLGVCNLKRMFRPTLDGL